MERDVLERQRVVHANAQRWCLDFPALHVSQIDGLTGLKPDRSTGGTGRSAIRQFELGPAVARRY